MTLIKKCYLFISILSLLNLILFFTHVKAVIQKCKNLSFLTAPKNTNKRTLVAFDIDGVLITCPDKALNPYYEEYLGLIDYQTFSQIGFTHPEALVNQDSPEIIQKLQQRYIKTIALTSRTIEVIGFIDSREIYNYDFTFGCLQRFGIDFSNSFPYWNNRLLALPQEPFPLFKNGIIYANNNSKGAALVTFLTTIVQHWEPTKIIFVDNELGNLESVEEALEAYNEYHENTIEFIGVLHTLEIDQARAQPLTNLDFQVRDFQINHFTETGQWLHDEEAKERMPDPQQSLQDLLKFIEAFEKSCQT